MDSQSRSAEALLNWLPAIAKAPQAYDFHTLLRCVEAAYTQHPRLGESLRWHQDPIRLMQPPFLQCAGQSIERFSIDTKPLQLSTLLFGLFGPQGPLPLHLTEYFYQRQTKDPAALAFIHLFHQRLLSLYHRAWADTEPVVALDRPQGHTFNEIVKSISGCQPRGKDSQHYYLDQDQPYFDEVTQYFYAGYLGMKQRPVEGLKTILNHYFQCRFEIERFIPRWLNLPKREGFYLKSSHNAAQHSAAVLGRSIQLGQRVRSAQQQLTLIACPRNWQQFNDFLPGARAFNTLKDIVHRYLGHTVDWHLQLQMKRQHCRPWRLGQRMKLGHNQWLVGTELSTEEFGTDTHLPNNSHKPKTQVCVEFNPAIYSKHLTQAV